MIDATQNIMEQIRREVGRHMCPALSKDASYPDVIRTCPGHDLAHVLRVSALCRQLADETGEPVDRLVLEAAALLHDIAREQERRDPSVDHAVEGARIARLVLREAGFPTGKTDAVCAAIARHRYRSGMIPGTIEGKLLQDADRLDACGAVGIAKAFSFGGARGREMYHAGDPFASRRPPDDKSYTLDHFYTKLLKLPDTLHTPAAKALAVERVAFLQAFLKQMEKEIGGPALP